MKLPFAPTPVRIMAIIQLCLSLSVLVWCLFQPFLTERYTQKKQQLLYDAVFSDQEHFHQLPIKDQTTLRRSFEAFQNGSESSFSEKMKQVLLTPPFLKSWIVFSIVISFLLLLRIEGAHLAAWILPFIVALYAVDNRMYGEQVGIDPIFPTENYLVENYMDGPLGESIPEQHRQLLNSWERYITAEWGSQYAFNVERVKRLPTPNKNPPHYQKESPLILLIYLFWNGLFAWFVSRRWE